MCRGGPHGATGAADGNNVIWIDKNGEKIVSSFSNERRSPAAGSRPPPPSRLLTRSGLQINLLMDDTLRPLPKVAFFSSSPPSIPSITGTH